MLRALVLGTAVLVGAAVMSPTVALADGWWEVTCNSDGNEGSGGCSNPDNMSGCTCETGSSASHAASVGSGLAVLGLVAYRLGRKRRK
jgi:hypothetical protein